VKSLLNIISPLSLLLLFETWGDDSLGVEFKLDDSDDSGSCSNNIPFTNIKHKQKDNSESFSIVFEDSGCAEKSSKSDSGERKYQ
jgi:hypothetical protein